MRYWEGRPLSFRCHNLDQDSDWLCQAMSFSCMSKLVRNALVIRASTPAAAFVFQIQTNHRPKADTLQISMIRGLSLKELWSFTMLQTWFRWRNGMNQVQSVAKEPEDILPQEQWLILCYVLFWCSYDHKQPQTHLLDDLKLWHAPRHPASLNPF